MIRRGDKVSGIKGKTFVGRMDSFHALIPGKTIVEKWDALRLTRYLENMRYVPRIFGRGRIRPQGDVIHVPIMKKGIQWPMNR